MLAAYTDRPRDLTHLESVEGRADASILLLCHLYHVASRTSVSLGKRNRRRQTTLNRPGQKVTTGRWPEPKAWPQLPVRGA